MEFGPGLIGMTLPPIVTPVEAGQLRLFAKATGQTEAIYLDEAAARAAGFRGLVAPPTFSLCLYMIGCKDYFGIFRRVWRNTDRMLHAEQRFEYGAPICAGDTITFDTAITDAYTKKDGALEFITETKVATNQLGEVVSRSAMTLVNPRQARAA